jgi:hypothetical protein
MKCISTDRCAIPAIFSLMALPLFVSAYHELKGYNGSIESHLSGRFGTGPVARSFETAIEHTNIERLQNHSKVQNAINFTVKASNHFSFANISINGCSEPGYTDFSASAAVETGCTINIHLSPQLTANTSSNAIMIPASSGTIEDHRDLPAVTPKRRFRTTTVSEYTGTPVISAYTKYAIDEDYEINPILTSVDTVPSIRLQRTQSSSLSWNSFNDKNLYPQFDNPSPAHRYTQINNGFQTSTGADFHLLTQDQHINKLQVSHHCFDSNCSNSNVSALNSERSKSRRLLYNFGSGSRNGFSNSIDRRGYSDRNTQMADEAMNELSRTLTNNKRGKTGDQYSNASYIYTRSTSSWSQQDYLKSQE